MGSCVECGLVMDAALSRTLLPSAETVVVVHSRRPIRVARHGLRHTHRMQVEQARRLVQSRAELDAQGITPREIAQGVAGGSLMRLARGRYVLAEAWAPLYPEQRQLLRVCASFERRRDTEAVYGFESAAVAHELPLYRVDPKHVHLCNARLNGRTKPEPGGVARHAITVADDDVVMIGGIPFTAFARTVADVIRRVSVAAGVALADAALRREAWNDRDHVYDMDAAESLRAQIASRLPLGGRGTKRARIVLAFADGRAQLPGESVSRVHLATLGFAPPQLQVAVPGPNSSSYYVDFSLDDVEAWGEFDGVGKYLDPALNDAGAAQAVLAEKEREDWIRGTTHRPFARWGTAHIKTARHLGQRLAAFQLFPQAR
ncbi:hypothetical protein ACWPKO_25785 (plasmid) [Coraliomargarita sp. W4R53]